MLAFIDEDAVWTGDFLVPSVAENTLDAYHAAVKEWCVVATEMCCKHQVLYTESGAEVRVYQQKCTLSEESMNTLFYDFLTNMFNVDLEYAAFGGRGCDFAVRLKLEPRQP